MPLPESFITDELAVLLPATDLAMRAGRLMGEPCGAGLAGMGDGTLDDDDRAAADVVVVVVTTGRCSSADQPLLKLLAELLTGKTDSGLTTTSVESESMAAVTLHPWFRLESIYSFRGKKKKIEIRRLIWEKVVGLTLMSEGAHPLNPSDGPISVGGNVMADSPSESSEPTSTSSLSSLSILSKSASILTSWSSLSRSKPPKELSSGKLKPRLQSIRSFLPSKSQKSGKARGSCIAE